MKKSILFSLVGPLLLSASPLLSQDKMGMEASHPSTTALRLTQCALKVSGMRCGGCAGIVERGLLKLDGVKAAKVNWKSGDVQVEYDSKKTTPENIVSALNQGNPGFRAELAKSKAK